MNEFELAFQDKKIKFGNGNPPVLIAGPCVIESVDLVMNVAEKLKKITDEYNVPFVFKSSFDKANRTSVDSFRGPGLERGLDILRQVKERFRIPITSDIHVPKQADIAADVLDIIQIPAFLSRQTDLLTAAGDTGKIINIKKGQFLDAHSMKYCAEKVQSTGNNKILLTERGTTFGYNNLVVDMRNLYLMRQLGFPVVFDGTHSVQQPGGTGKTTGGNREFVPLLVKAAIAVGLNVLFLEVHPDPDEGLSDAANMIDFNMLESLLQHIYT